MIAGPVLRTILLKCALPLPSALLLPSPLLLPCGCLLLSALRLLLPGLLRTLSPLLILRLLLLILLNALLLRLSVPLWRLVLLLLPALSLLLPLRLLLLILLNALLLRLSVPLWRLILLLLPALSLLLALRLLLLILLDPLLLRLSGPLWRLALLLLPALSLLLILRLLLLILLDPLLLRLTGPLWRLVLRLLPALLSPLLILLLVLVSLLACLRWLGLFLRALLLPGRRCALLLAPLLPFWLILPFLLLVLLRVRRDYRPEKQNQASSTGGSNESHSSLLLFRSLLDMHAGDQSASTMFHRNLRHPSPRSAPGVQPEVRDQEEALDHIWSGDPTRSIAQFASRSNACRCRPRGNLQSTALACVSKGVRQVIRALVQPAWSRRLLMDPGMLLSQSV